MEYGEDRELRAALIMYQALASVRPDVRDKTTVRIFDQLHPWEDAMRIASNRVWQYGGLALWRQMEEFYGPAA